MSVTACSVVCAAAASLLLAAWPAADGANVLVFMPMPLKSHFGGFQTLFEELARRGHNVTVVSPFPLREDRRVANYTDVALPLVNFGADFNLMQLTKQNFFSSVTSRWLFAYILSTSIDNAIIKDLIQSDSNSFDLVLIESFYQEYTVALGHKFNAPVINLSPAMVWTSMSKWLQIPSTFSYIPDCCIGVSSDMSFVERLKNTLTGILQMYVENFLYIPMIKSIMTKHFTYKGWESRPPLEDMLKNVSLTLMNANHAIGICRPTTQGVVEVGGMHIKAPKPLPQDLLDYIDSAKYGVIYFSFGSIITLSNLPEEKLKILVNVMGRLKQKVIMKWVPDSGIKLPQNIITGSWLPQNDILAHPNVKLFITHGGFNSIEEAVFNAKPLVGIPFFADQVSNMKNVEKTGYGKLVSLHELNEECLKSAIEEVISNQTFIDQAVIQSLMYKDQPMTPLDRAIYWIEYVIRNDGAKYLISDSAGLNDLQYFLFDVNMTLLISTGIIMWLCYHSVTKIKSKLKTSKK